MYFYGYRYKKSCSRRLNLNFQWRWGLNSNNRRPLTYSVVISGRPGACRELAYICSTMQVQYTRQSSTNRNSQHTGTLSAATCPHRRFCYRPAVFFHQLCLTELSFPREKIARAFKKKYRFFLLVKKMYIWNCVNLRCLYGHECMDF